MKQAPVYWGIVVILGWMLIGCLPAQTQQVTQSPSPETAPLGTSHLPTQTSDPFPVIPVETDIPHPSPSLLPSPGLQKTRTTETVEMCSPLAGHSLEVLPEIVSDPYLPPPGGREGRHMGVDFSYYQWQDRVTISGVEVQAIFAGKVAGALTENNIPYGYTVIIETDPRMLPDSLLQDLQYEADDVLYVLYAHMQDKPTVSIGQEVVCGQTLGLVGQTGGEGTPYTIPHLHVEMRLGPGGWQTDKMGFYDTRLSEAARETYLFWRTSGEFRHFDPMLLLGKAAGQP